MTTRLFRACALLLLAIAYCAGSASVSVAAQAQKPAQKKAPAVTPAKKIEPPPAKAQTPPPATTRAATKAATPAPRQVQPPPAPPVQPEPPAVERVPVADTFSYKPEGRRDPFLSLLTRALPSEGRAPLKKPEGLRGVMWDEISLRGILQGLGGAIAMVQAPDNKIYRVRVGDQFYDAVVKAITADSLIVLQEVNDPLSMQKQRERRKTLHVVEEVIK